MLLPFENPQNDATDIGNVLEQMNFEVIRITDATYMEIEVPLGSFIRNFSMDRKTKRSAWCIMPAMVCKATMRITLCRSTRKIEFEDDVPHQCFPVQKIILGNMERTNARMNILILDACREQHVCGTLTRLEGRIGGDEVSQGIVHCLFRLHRALRLRWRWAQRALHPGIDQGD